MVYNRLEGVELPDNLSERAKRVILFDPTDCYSRITIDPYKRMQSIGMEKLFVNPEPNICACGCNQELTGRRTRWATDDCSGFAIAVYHIIWGKNETISQYMQVYLPYQCSQCQRQPYLIEKERTVKSYDGKHTWVDWSIRQGINVDHIVAVINGGGGCWLGNYQYLCEDCHRIKTARDKAERNRLKPMPFSKEFL